MRVYTNKVLVSVALLLLINTLGASAQSKDSTNTANTFTLPETAVKLGTNANSPRMELLNQYITAKNAWNNQSFETFKNRGQSYFIDLNIKPIKRYPNFSISLQYEYMDMMNEGRVTKVGHDMNSGRSYEYSYNQMINPSFSSISIIPFLPVNLSKKSKVNLILGAGISYNYGQLQIDITDYQNIPEGVSLEETSTKWSNSNLGAIYMLRLETHLINKTGAFVTAGYRNAKIKNIANKEGDNLQVNTLGNNVNLDFSGFFCGFGIKYQLN